MTLAEIHAAKDDVCSHLSVLEGRRSEIESLDYALWREGNQIDERLEELRRRLAELTGMEMEAVAKAEDTSATRRGDDNV